jgi:hypothetical protein
MLDFILNVLLISIPEEAFIVIIAFLIMSRYDLLDTTMLKQSIINILIPTIPVAIYFNLIKIEIVNTQNIIIASGYNIIINILPFIILYYLLYFVYIKNYSKHKGKVLLGMFGGFISYFFIEGFILTFMTYFMNIPMDNIGNNFETKLLLSLPCRIIEYGIIFYLLTKFNLNINFKSIFVHKSTRNSIIIISLFDITILILTAKFIICSNFLNEFPMYKLMILSVTLLTVIFNYVSMWYMIGSKSRDMRYLN